METWRTVANTCSCTCTAPHDLGFCRLGKDCGQVDSGPMQDGDPAFLVSALGRALAVQGGKVLSRPKFEGKWCRSLSGGWGHWDDI